MGSGETGLLLSMVDLDRIVKNEFSDVGSCGTSASAHGIASALGCGENKPEILRSRGGNSDGLLGDSSGSDLAYGLPIDSVIGTLEFIVESRRLGSPLSADGSSDKGESLYRLRGVEFILDPGSPAVLSGRKKDSVRKVSVGKLLNGEVAAGRGHLGAQLRHALFTLGNADGDNRHVPAPGLEIRTAVHVLEFSDRVVYFGESEIDRFLSVRCNLNGTPSKFFHGVLGLHPWSSGGAPTGSGSDGSLQTEGIRDVDGIAESILPGVRHIRDFFDDSRGTAHHVAAGIELLESADSGAVHPFQVLFYTVFGNVSVHPMPPHTNA